MASSTSAGSVHFWSTRFESRQLVDRLRVARSAPAGQSGRTRGRASRSRRRSTRRRSPPRRPPVRDDSPGVAFEQAIGCLAHRDAAHPPVTAIWSAAHGAPRQLAVEDRPLDVEARPVPTRSGAPVRRSSFSGSVHVRRHSSHRCSSFAQASVSIFVVELTGSHSEAHLIRQLVVGEAVTDHARTSSASIPGSSSRTATKATPISPITSASGR